MKTGYTKLASIARKIFNPFSYSEIEKNFQLGMSFLKLNEVKGDYAEFGVYRGDSMITAHHFAKTNNLNMNFFGFDSFQGLPKPKKEDKNFSWKEGDYSASIKEVEKRLRKNGLIDFHLIRGWFKETLKRERDENTA